MKHEQWRILLPLVLGAALFSAAIVVVVGAMIMAEATQSPVVVKTGDIANNPAQYHGKRVSVRAEVEEVLSRQVFLLDKDRLIAWPDVLVIAPALTVAIPEDTVVTVIGTVRSFVDADSRREDDWDWWGDLDTDVEVTFRNRPVIVAESVKTAAGAELVRR